MNILTRLGVYVRFSRGIIRQYTGLRTRNRRHFQAAVRHYSIALFTDVEHFNARRYRGLLRWRELNDARGAIEDFSYLIEHRPQFHDALFFRGMAFVQLNDFYAAAHDFSAFLRQAPGSKWQHSAHIQLQGLYTILDDLPKLLPPPAGFVLDAGE